MTRTKRKNPTPAASPAAAAAEGLATGGILSKLFPVSDPASPEYPLPNRLREMALGERPQERLEKHGASALSDTELLAMLLRSGTRGQDVMTLSSRLIAEAGSLAGLLGWHDADFRKLKGIGRVKALQLLTVMEIAKRVIGQQTGEEPLLNRADLVIAYLRPYMAGLEVEKFFVLCLNRKNRLLKRIEISSGTAHTALAHPREVFRAAMRESACAIVCAHNHPSGDPAPSAADMHVTRLLREAARTVDIQLLDHVILGRPACDPTGRGYYSFREVGAL
ncbi:MAG: JAB domain-containing protein [Opitutus sp.]|nr:JAB domain-containing protein [Opitutus sp.]